ncbi:MAG: BMP family protein [Bacillota bacterium]
MRKLFALLLVALLAFSVFGCAAPANEEPQATAAPETTQPAAEPTQAPEATVDPASIKIALLLPGSPTDGGYNQLGAEGIQAVADKYGYTVTILDSISTSEQITSESETLAGEGYNIIIGHGSQFATPFESVSPDWPDTYFITNGGAVVTENQFPINMRAEEGAYLAGIIGGMITKSKIVGTVSGGDFPAYTKQTRAFVLGAKSVDSSIEGVSAILSAVDSNEAYETSMSQVQNGADVLYANANAATLGTLKAAEDSDLYAFGGNANYIESYPNTVLLGYVTSYSATYGEAVQLCLEGIDTPSIQYFGISSGVITFFWNDALLKQLPNGDAIVAAVNAAMEKIKSGEIHVPNEYEDVAAYVGP